MSTLLDRTRQLLADRPRSMTLAKIACDLGLTEGWLLDMRRPTIGDPGVIKVQKLYEYLSGRKLEL